MEAPPRFSSYPTIPVPDFLECQPLVMDAGSYMTKCGLAGDDHPRAVFPTVMGRPKNGGIMVGMDAKDCFVGDEAVAKRGILLMKRPVALGQIVNFNDMEKIWHHLFYDELRVVPEEHPVAVLEHPETPRSQREKMCCILFETFNVLAFSLLCRASMALQASGRTSGLVVNVGGGVTHVTPVYEGHSVWHCNETAHFGSEMETHTVSHLLTERGYDMTTIAELTIVRDIVQKHCLIPLDFEEEQMKYEAMDHLSMSYELPDGSILPLADERIKAGEFYWNPSLLSDSIRKESCRYYSYYQTGETLQLDTSLQDMVVNSVSKLPSDLQSVMLENTVLGGAAASRKGFVARAEREINSAVASRSRLSSDVVASNVVRLSGPPESQTGAFAVGAWMGASHLVTEAEVEKRWIQKEMYDEVGPGIVRRMCF